MSSGTCKISSWGCVYHACMSDDCQKEQVLNNGSDFGKGDCNNQDAIQPPANFENMGIAIDHLMAADNRKERIKRKLMPNI